MKLKIDWMKLGKAVWAALKPVLLGALGGGIVSVSSGCSSLTPANKTQTMSVVGVGLPAIAIITSSTQAADAGGSDTNATQQSNPITTNTKIGK